MPWEVFQNRSLKLTPADHWLAKSFRRISKNRRRSCEPGAPVLHLCQWIDCRFGVQVITLVVVGSNPTGATSFTKRRSSVVEHVNL